jgi:hypothetical protein
MLFDSLEVFLGRSPWLQPAVDRRQSQGGRLGGTALLVLGNSLRGEAEPVAQLGMSQVPGDPPGTNLFTRQEFRRRISAAWHNVLLLHKNNCICAVTVPVSVTGTEEKSHMLEVLNSKGMGDPCHLH